MGACGSTPGGKGSSGGNTKQRARNGGKSRPRGANGAAGGSGARGGGAGDDYKPDSTPLGGPLRTITRTQQGDASSLHSDSMAYCGHDTRRARRIAAFTQSVATATQELRNVSALSDDMLRHYCTTIVNVSHGGTEQNRAAMITDVVPLLTAAFATVHTLQAREWVLRAISQVTRCARGEPKAMSITRHKPVFAICCDTLRACKGKEHASIATHACDLVRYLVTNDADRAAAVDAGVPALLSDVITFSTVL